MFNSRTPDPRYRSEKVTRNVQELSKKLLEGWTLLSESCPNLDCNVPLVQNNKKQLYCISCDRYCARDKDRIRYADETEMKDEPLKVTISNNNEAEPNLRKEEVRVLSPIASTNAPWNPTTSVEIKEKLDTRSSPQGNSCTCEAKSIIGVESSESGKIAAKLLEGWLLLNQSCPDCSVPLVSDKNNGVYCVSCQEYKKIGDNQELSTPTKLTTQTPHPQQPTKTHAEDNNNHFIPSSVVTCLHHKINQAKRILDGLSLKTSQEIIEAKNLCKIIESCTLSIATLQNLK